MKIAFWFRALPLVFLGVFAWGNPVIHLAPGCKGSLASLSGFVPIGETGFYRFSDFIIRSSGPNQVELFDYSGPFFPPPGEHEPMIFVQRDPKSTLEKPQIVLGGATKDAFGFSLTERGFVGGTIDRQRLAGMPLDDQLIRAGFEKRAGGVFAYVGEDGKELGYLIVAEGVITHVIKPATISLRSEYLNSLPLTLHGTDTVVVPATYRGGRDQTRSVLRMENSVGKFNYGLPLKFEGVAPLDQIDARAFGGLLVSASQMGAQVWQKNRDALDPRRSLQTAFDAADQAAASLSPSREQIAEWMYRIDAGSSLGLIADGNEFELTPGRKFRVSPGLSTMGAVGIPLRLPHENFPLPNFSASVTNLTTGKSLHLDFAVAAMIAAYGISNPPTDPEQSGYDGTQPAPTLEQLAELFR